MTTCREDGILLKPDRPAVPNKKTWKQNGPNYELLSVSATSSTFRSISWFYVIGTELPYEYVVYPEDLGVSNSEWVQFNWMTKQYEDFTPFNSLKFSQHEDSYPTKFSYYIVAQRKGNWVFLGDTSVSKQRYLVVNSKSSPIQIRFSSVHFEPNGSMSAEIIGSSSEKVKMMAIYYDTNNNGNIVSIQTTLSEGGRGYLWCNESGMCRS